MKFCENCGNMYYIKIDDEKSNILNYYCRKCGNIDKNYTSVKKMKIIKEEL
jgi:DNA-directed RNA polymerase subunit M/transcription elongation factor TFIIS